MAMEKVMFALDVEDGWPPVGSEGVWCERIDNNYKLVNSPFFIPNLAFGDVFSATPDEVNEHVFEFEVIKESGHSLIWVMNNKGINTKAFIEKLTRIGCNVETIDQFSFMSIDVTPSTDIDDLDSLLDIYEEKGLEYAFPVWRHGD